MDADVDFDMILMDPEARKESGESHPLSENSGGVYLCYVDGCDGEVPLYVGRTVNLRVRLWQHWRGEPYSEWVAKYLDWLMEEQGNNNNICPKCHSWPKSEGKCVSCMVRVRAWFVEEEDKRRWLEHELIASLKPAYNKA